MEDNKEVVETKKKKNGIVRLLYWLIIIVGCAFIFIGSYKIGYKLGNYFGDKKTDKKTESIELKKASQDVYEFSFSDGTVPGRSYAGSINLKTGDTKITVGHSCSTAPGTCPVNTPDEYEGTLKVEDLNKVIDFLEENKYPSFQIVEKTNDGEYSLSEKTYFIIEYVQYKLEAKSNDELADEIYKNKLS